MKHISRKLVSLILLMILLMTFAAPEAQARDAGDVVYFSVDGCVPEKDYVFMLLKQGTSVGSIRNSSILYIDQLTANSSCLEVAVVYPNFTACDVVVGGEFSNGAASPRHLGMYSAARLPKQLNEIGTEAFCGSKMTHVYLSENVAVIGERAFANCQQLAYIYIPASVTEIASDAFAGCADMVIGCPDGSEAQQFAATYGIECKVIR